MHQFLGPQQTWLPAIHPVGHSVQIAYTLEHYDDALYDLSGIELPQSIRRSVRKRRAEFLAGRYCAAQCLSQMGAAVAQVGIGEHRNPLWPGGVCGSISHTDNVVAAMTAHSDALLGLGIDVQRVDAETMASTQHLFITDDDAAMAHEHGVDTATLLTLIFSAKECFFKMAYPYVRRYFDFDAVRCTAIDWPNSTVTLVITHTLHARLPAGHIVRAQFHLQDHFVRTVLGPLP